MDIKLINPALFLFKDPVKIDNKVYIKTPTVEDVLKDDNYSTFTRIFTIMTREIFVLERNVDALEKKFPTVWEFMWDDQADKAFGKLFGGSEDMTFTDVVFKGLSYWTGLHIDGVDENGTQTGFIKLGNKKIMHVSSEWIIDEEEFNKFRQLIRYIVSWTPPEFMAPEITNDIKHRDWVRHYKRRTEHDRKRSTTWAEKILILSIGSGGYISPNDIKNMTIFEFSHLFNAIRKKEAYDKEFDVFVSPKFMPKEGTKPTVPKDWRTSFNTGFNNINKEIK